MPKLIVTTRGGQVREVQGKAGYTVMEVIRDNDLADPFALCGGSCSCATCHVYIDRSFADVIAARTVEEEDLLSGTDHMRPESRLSCQIKFDAKLDGLKVTIAPED